VTERFGLRGRIALVAMIAAACALISVPLIVGPQLRQSYVQRAEEELLAEARLLARLVRDPLARGAGPEELDPLVDEAALPIPARATVIDAAGRVLADSAVSGAALLALDNHARRPEILAALEQGSGTSIRRSATVEDELLYAAVPVRLDGELLGVARVALTLEGVEAQVAELRRAVALSLGLAFVIAVLLSAPLSASVIGPLQDVMAVARRFATGDLTPRIRVRRDDELGELARILNLSADQLQARLAESQRDRARTEAMLAAMEEGVLAVDHQGRILVANEMLRRWLELDDPVGRPWESAIRQPEVAEVLLAVLETGRRSAREITTGPQRHVFAITGVPFPDAEGMPSGAVLTFHDITERRRGDQVRRDFVANASHELRTPLTSIRGFVEALEDGAVHDPSTSARFLGKIRTHADRMAALVEDLLELSRLESGDRSPNWEEVSPDRLVEEVITSFSGRSAHKSLTLTHEGPGAPVVLADAERVMRILENLVDNAVKYTPSGGHVEVHTETGPDGGALLQVRDDGPGIPPEHLSRLFERFYRVDKARSRDLGGTGLGLSIVRHLAEGMGGTVSVESEVGRGSCFTVALPREPGSRDREHGERA
jgi:two-component system phosphate regulon sensor histidine kinase PhoR